MVLAVCVLKGVPEVGKKTKDERQKGHFFIRKLGLGQTSCQRIVGVCVFKGVPEVGKNDKRTTFFIRKCL